MKNVLLVAMIAAVASVALAANAATPVEVFRQVQPSVLMLDILDKDGKTSAALSAVIVADAQAVSTCDSITGASALRVASAQGQLTATIRARDRRRNLCLLSVPGLTQAPLALPAASDSIQPGSRIYAISNSLGLGIGISEGVISGIRTESDTEYIQHTAPVSPGSTGGALVDAQGRLLGVILYRQRDGQNVNFAVGAKSIADIGREDEAERAFAQRQEQAQRLEREARWPALAEHAQQWSTLYPKDADAWHWLALAANRQNDAETEEQALQTLRRLEPASTETGAKLVSVLLRRDKYQAALDLANSLLELRQEDAELWALLGAAEQAAGNLERAEAAYRKAVSLNPWRLDAHMGLATLADKRGDRAGETAAWQRLAQLYPDDPGIRFRLVMAYLRDGRPARAYALLERLSGAETQAADSLFLKGSTLAALGRPVDAIRAYRQSLAGAPKFPDWVQASLGEAYRNLQRFPEAIAAFREAVRLAPQNDEWRYQLTITLKDGGHIEEAVAIDRQLVEKYPKDASAWVQLGFAQARLARHAESIQALERSLELDPKQGKVWAVLIGQYRAAGRADDVRKAYDKLRGVDGEWAEKAYRESLLPFEESKL